MKPNEVLDSAIEKFSSKEHLDNILKAKDEYFELTGKISEEDDDFESRMNGFNYWYLTQRGKFDEGTLLDEYLNELNAEESVVESLNTINHSLFEYAGTGFTGKHIFKDILHDKKIKMPKGNFPLQLVKDDIFIARVVDFNGDVEFLGDISILPGDIKSILVKESKKVRKLQDPKRDLQFLMQIEKLKTKWRHYGHVDPKQIFKFTY